ncbi:molybdenum cofactor sulfurase [Actinidia rufa]|uniref:Molybdenum cofactor sulfurase n=1 Tax=Actinidia rufa TaxID=165716 RepID=A0A7J0G4W2_9ERIC|nr:molybdenum cofactor sulfurase [Actinidia rufa]
MDSNSHKEQFLKDFGDDYGYPNAPKNIDEIRASEFKRLEGLVYLDHAGASLYSELQMEAIFKGLTTNVYGNPPQVLDFCHASARDYKCILTSGATAALKLVGEAFPWSSQSTFMYTMENHNSALGIREYALSKGATAFAIDIEEAAYDGDRFRSPVSSIKVLQHPIQRRNEAVLLEEPAGDAYNLFAFPSECNFSDDDASVHSCKTSFYLMDKSRGRWMVLIDAAKGCATAPPDLSKYQADFVVISFYKLFGYPTGLGALIVHAEAAKLLKKTYFSGGTVAASIADIDFVKRREGVEEFFEDGTISFLSTASIHQGFKILNTLTMSAISRPIYPYFVEFFVLVLFLPTIMSGSDVDNVENVVVPPPPPRPDFSLSQHTPGARITCELLNGKNFAAWSRSVRLFLGGKGKSGWLLGTITKPNATDPKFVQWEIDNCTILGWLFNSMEPRIYHASQASLSLSVEDYFAYLQSRWEELAQYEPLSEFTTEGGIAARRLDRQHTYQFLMGLKPEFEALRTQIFNTTPMPSIFETFAMLDGDERRHRLLQLPPPPVTESTIPDQMALAASGSRFSGGRSSSGRAPCSFCRGVTHGRDRCFKFHPELRETFKRNKEKSKASPRTAAISETSYGSPAAPTAPDLHQLQTQFHNQMEQLQLQFQTQLGTPHSFNLRQGEAPEDPSIFSRPVPLFESPQVASPTLPPVLTSDPRHMYSRRPPASDPLPQSSPESGNISPISSPVLRRYPTCDRRPPDKLGFSNPNATKHSIAQKCRMTLQTAAARGGASSHPPMSSFLFFQNQRGSLSGIDCASVVLCL